MEALVQLGLGGGALALLYTFGKPLLSAHLATLKQVGESMASITKSNAEIVRTLQTDRDRSEERHAELLDRHTQLFERIKALMLLFVVLACGAWYPADVPVYESLEQRERPYVLAEFEQAGFTVRRNAMCLRSRPR